MSDTRTNSGIDNVSVFRKMTTWSEPGERLITMMTAGNLATTQAVVSQLDERWKTPSERSPSLLAVPTMYQAAKLVGETLREAISLNAKTGQAASTVFNATIILGGQIKGMPPRLFMIYSEGNFIEASADTPFFQIGETKYGRPILVRAFDPDMSFEDAAKLLMVSFDSTMRANLSVGMPLDLQVYESDTFEPAHERRIEHHDAYFDAVSSSWSEALRQAFTSLPAFQF